MIGSWPALRALHAFSHSRRTGSLFPWQSLALELIPNGSRPNNYLIATAKNKEYGRSSGYPVLFEFQAKIPFFESGKQTSTVTKSEEKKIQESQCSLN